MIIGTSDKNLDEIVGGMKSYTSTQFKKMIKDHPHESRKEWMIWMKERAGKKNNNNNDWQFWQQHNKPLEITDQVMFDTTLKYIHDNPVIAGFVNEAEDWKYSSAADFCDFKGLIKLSFT
jgi:REP element-mobilizing transposase RayT